MDISLLSSRFLCCGPQTPDQKPGSHHLAEIQVMLSFQAPWDSSKPIFKSFTTKSHFPYTSHLACICILSVLLNTEAACLGYNKVIWWRKVLLLLLGVQSRTSSGELRKREEKEKKKVTWMGRLQNMSHWLERVLFIYLFFMGNSGSGNSVTAVLPLRQRSHPHCNLCSHYWKSQKPVSWRAAKSSGAVW